MESDSSAVAGPVADPAEGGALNTSQVADQIIKGLTSSESPGAYILLRIMWVFVLSVYSRGRHSIRVGSDTPEYVYVEKKN